MGLIVVEWTWDFYTGVVDAIRSTENHFFRGIKFIAFHLWIIGVLWLFVVSFFWNWEVPVGIISFWLICEAIRALGIAIQK